MFLRETRCSLSSQASSTDFSPPHMDPTDVINSLVSIPTSGVWPSAWPTDVAQRQQVVLHVMYLVGLNYKFQARCNVHRTWQYVGDTFFTTHASQFVWSLPRRLGRHGLQSAVDRAQVPVRSARQRMRLLWVNALSGREKGSQTTLVSGGAVCHQLSSLHRVTSSTTSSQCTVYTRALLQSPPALDTARCTTWSRSCIRALVTSSPRFYSTVNTGRTTACIAMGKPSQHSSSPRTACVVNLIYWRSKSENCRLQSMISNSVITMAQRLHFDRLLVLVRLVVILTRYM